MIEPIALLKGVNGQLELYDNKVVIKRKGALAKMTQGFFKGDKEIFIKQISGIQVKLGTGFTNGYIQFTLSGGIESKRGIYDATRDENTLMFSKKENETVKMIKSNIEDLMSTNNSSQTINPLSAADELKKFKALLDDGTITQDEFDTKKKQLLRAY